MGNSTEPTDSHSTPARTDACRDRPSGRLRCWAARRARSWLSRSKIAETLGPQCSTAYELRDLSANAALLSSEDAEWAAVVATARKRARRSFGMRVISLK